MIACKQLCSNWYCQQKQSCYEAKRANIDKKRVQDLIGKTKYLEDAYPKPPEGYRRRRDGKLVPKRTSANKDKPRKSSRKSNWGKKRLRIFERDSFKCTYCGVVGTEDILTVDHIVSQSSGGKDNEENLTTACQFCNNLKGSMTVEVFNEYRKELINKGVIKY